MQLTLEFGGGLELLCDSKKIHNVNVEQQNGEDKLTMKDLLSWVRTNLIKERPEMFMKGDTVRPGVLVLVNDCDWELSGQLNTSLEEKDVIVFISTLHGNCEEHLKLKTKCRKRKPMLAQLEKHKRC